MKYAYGLNGQSHPFVIDLPYYMSGGLTVGQLVKFGADGGATAMCCVADVDSTAADVMGCVAEEGITANGTNLQTPLVVRAKIVVNSDAVYNAQWDDSVTYDLNCSAFTSTTATHASKDDNLDGGWLYVNTDAATGAGQLRYVTGANATSKTVGAFTVTPTAADDVMFIHPFGLGGVGVGSNPELSATFDELNAGDLQPDGTNWILNNFIEYAGAPREILDPAKHATLDGLNTLGVKFTSDIYFLNRQTDHDA